MAAQSVASEAVFPNGNGEASPDSASAVSRKDLSKLREQIQGTIGRLVVAMMNLPRYRSQALADLSHLVLDPLVRDRIVAANIVRAEDGNGAESEAVTAGFAIWASVSE